MGNQKYANFHCLSVSYHVFKYTVSELQLAHFDAWYIYRSVLDTVETQCFAGSTWDVCGVDGTDGHYATRMQCFHNRGGVKLSRLFLENRLFVLAFMQWD